MAWPLPDIENRLPADKEGRSYNEEKSVFFA
jgi:hypothetical protein